MESGDTSDIIFTDINKNLADMSSCLDIVCDKLDHIKSTYSPYTDLINYAGELAVADVDSGKRNTLGYHLLILLGNMSPGT